MTLYDLFFLASVLFVLTLCICIAVSAGRRRWQATGRLGRLLGGFVVSYAIALIAVAVLTPRRFYDPGQRRCFDDWCVAAMEAKVVDGSTSVPCQGHPAGRTWIATIEVSSDAKRVRQRASDARAELEDRQGRRYQPCTTALTKGSGPGRLLSDEFGPGESFAVLLPFRLPADTTPAGLVLHHGDIPGVVIVGADQSLLHPPALQRVALGQPH
jgi:hypothetical protein